MLKVSLPIPKAQGHKVRMPVIFGSMEIGNGETTTTPIVMAIGKNLEKDVRILKDIGTMVTKGIIGLKGNGTKTRA